MQRTLNILIVDDEEIVHHTLGEYLCECGHSVEHSLNAQAALEMLQGSHYDLTLLDVRMPGLDGTELFGEIQKLHPGMPVVMITGHGNAEMSEKLQNMGAAAFLLKPVSLTELDEIVDRVQRA